MKNFNTTNNNLSKDNNRRHHIVISEVNYNKLKSLGKFGESFDKVLGEVLSKTNQQNKIMMLESGQETLAVAKTNNNLVTNNFQPSISSSTTTTAETLTDEIISQ